MTTDNNGWTNDQKPWENLANAIILQAVKDYKDALKIIRYQIECGTLRFWMKTTEYYRTIRTIKDVQRFARSEHLIGISDINLVMVLSKVQKEVFKYEDRADQI